MSIGYFRTVFMPVPADTQAFREAIGHFATGVTVVTSFGRRGPAGLTANAVCSLSLDPMLMLACIDRGSRTLAAIRASGRLAVNVLSRAQEPLAVSFAGKEPEQEKFADVPWTELDGLPVIDGVVAWLGGEVRDLVDGGDHLIAITTVTSMDARGGEPLLYFRGSFRGLG